MIRVIRPVAMLSALLSTIVFPVSNAIAMPADNNSSLKTKSGKEIDVVINSNHDGSAAFVFSKTPRPSKNDAATTAEFILVEGRADANGGNLNSLHDGALPAEDDQPSANFFFRAGTDGGRLLVDLKTNVSIKAINTYSWHSADRGPQVYSLYASDGTATGFNARPQRGVEPDSCGWQRVANVDTRPKDQSNGGQYGVSISAGDEPIGHFRYLLFDIHQTENTDSFGNTFYSEIDVVDANGPKPEPVLIAKAETIKDTVEIADGKYVCTIETTETPDLTEWVRKEIVPMVKEWYPKLIEMLPSEGYQAPTKFSITFFKDMAGVADTSGTRIRCAAKFMRSNLKGESKGAIFHEVMHVVQQYGRGRRLSPNAVRAPGWLTEGMTDYVRFYKFEPQTKGAEISKRNLDRARYDGSYRVTANFLNYLIEKYDAKLIQKLNEAIREGKYNLDFWKICDNKSLPDLGAEWKKALEDKFAAEEKK